MVGGRSSSVIALVTMLGACVPTPTPATTATSVDDCSHLLGMPAEQAATELAQRGVTPTWRLEYTDTEQGPVSEAVEGVPEGAVTNLVISDGEVIVFVAPAEDPLHQFVPLTLICP